MRRQLAHLLPLLLAACAAPAAIRPPPGAPEQAAAADWSHATTVTVTLDEFEFTPAQFTLHAGQPVRLRLENVGSRSHDFTAPGLFGTVALRPDTGQASPLANGGIVEIPFSQTREVFLLPMQHGSFDFFCGKPLHATLGMRGRVIVD